MVGLLTFCIYEHLKKRDQDFTCVFIKCCLVITESIWVSKTALYASELMNYTAPLANSQWLSCLTFLILLDVSFQQMVLNGHVYTIILIIVKSWMKARAFLLAHENNSLIMPYLHAQAIVFYINYHDGVFCILLWLSGTLYFQIYLHRHYLKNAI